MTVRNIPAFPLLVSACLAIPIAGFAANAARASSVTLTAVEFDKGVRTGFSSTIRSSSSQTLSTTFDDPVDGSNTISQAFSSFGSSTRVSAKVTVTPPPHGGAPDNPGGFAASSILYYFEIVGPNGQVPINVSNATGGYSYTLAPVYGFTPVPSDFGAGLSIGTDTGFYVTGCAGGFVPACAMNTSFDVSDTYNMDANVPISVFMSVNVHSTGAGIFSTFVDPDISIAPGHSDYSLIFSTGIQTSATPLPAALPLFVSGLGGLGLLGWRRKKKAHGAGKRIEVEVPKISAPGNGLLKLQNTR